MLLAEFGYLALIASSLIATLLVILPFLKRSILRGTRKALLTFLAYALFAFTFFSFSILVFSLLQDDFSVQYVANHSNRFLPIAYKIAASWGGHQGSMLFLVVLFSFWTAIFAHCFRHDFTHKTLGRFVRTEAPSQATFKKPLVFCQKNFSMTLGVLGSINLLFLLFLLCISNPFQRLFPAPLEGGDLNPMLQDIGLIFHPPLLYLGYSAFAVVFALTMAFLLQKNVPAEFCDLLRPWCLWGWLFLTFGILLGAWWAYYELGWGGWWFWDPTENASLMPWLIATALLHNLRRTTTPVLPEWTLLLALSVFLFSLLGIFIVRSGMLTSIHAFAIEDSRGFALLGIFCSFSFFSLGAFTTRFQIRLQSKGEHYTRQHLLMLNILLSFATFIVFLGTFYPFFYRLFINANLSVGAPYFNQLFLPLIFFCLVGMSTIFFPHYCMWHHRLVYFGLGILSVISSSYLIHCYSLPHQYFSWQAFAFLSIAFWIMGLSLWKAMSLTPRRASFAMLISHFGIALMIFAATMSSHFSQTRNVVLAPQQQAQLPPFTFKYEARQNVLGSNFTAEQAIFRVAKQNHTVKQVIAEKRYYDVRNQQMSEIGIASTWLGDFYIVMGDKHGNGSFSFRLQYKPFMVWLWVGGIFVGFGGVLRLYQSKQRWQNA